MYKEMLKEYFDNHMEEILTDLNEIISIQSVADENSQVKPFGEGSARALKWGMDFMEKIGMTVENCDNYAVHGDYLPSGEAELAVLSHLDTVPAGEGWSFPPFELTQNRGILYGRGTIDDKGPSLAVLWGVKAIRELNLPIRKNFRVIFGGDEEGDCGDIVHYQKKYPFPKMIFTPDGSFPVLNCEKGMVHLNFSGEYVHNESSKNNEKYVRSLNCGTVINAIPGRADFTLCGIEKEELLRMVATLGEGWRVECQQEENCVNGTLYGHSSHGSRPERGLNTACALLKILSENGFEGLDKLSKLFPLGECNGESAGMGYSDEVSGMMTCALTLLKIEGRKLSGGIDIRFPIDRKYSDIKSDIGKALAKAEMTVIDCEGMESHYVPQDSTLVRTLLAVYEDVLGEKGYCIAEGGITYVHETESGVAFGAEFPEDNNNMHGADEHISLETFKINLNMYANAILELCK